MSSTLDTDQGHCEFGMRGNCLHLQITSSIPKEMWQVIALKGHDEITKHQNLYENEKTKFISRNDTVNKLGKMIQMTIHELMIFYIRSWRYLLFITYPGPESFLYDWFLSTLLRWFTEEYMYYKFAIEF